MKITTESTRRASAFFFEKRLCSGLTAMFAALLTLNACNTTQVEDGKPAAADQSSSAAKVTEFGAWGVDTESMSKDIEPGDDFYRYVNKGWLDTAKIPEGLSAIESFTALQLKTEKQVGGIIKDAMNKQAAQGSPEEHIATLYASYTDIQGRNKQGMDRLKGEIGEIMALKSRSNIAARMARAGYVPTIANGVTIDAGNPSRYIAALIPAGLGLPNRDYYLNKGEPFGGHRKAYLAYIEGVLKRAGLANAKSRAKAIFQFETEIAKRHWTAVENRDAVKRYKVMDKTQLLAFAPGFDWTAYLKIAGYEGVDKFQLMSNTAIKAIAALFGKTPVPVLRDHLAFSYLNANAVLLSEEWENAHFDMYDRKLQGIATPRPLPERSVQFVNELLGEEVAKLYVERYFPPAKKAKTKEMVGYIVDAMHEHLQKLDWMDEPTRKEALTKLSQFETQIGYPDQWHDYTSIRLNKDDLVGNVLQYVEWARKDDRAKLDGPARRWEWGHNPQEVNAFYSPVQNQIVFLAAILQPPFFDPNADPAVNFGALGMVVGHEIGHGFDDQGSHSDGTGKLREWWTQEARAHFNERTQKLAAQYDRYSPIPGAHINGKLTLGENIGDMGGLSLAYSAYQKYKAEKYPDGKEPILDGFTGNQRFFLADAQVWRSITTDDRMRFLLLTNPHSPGEFRTNGIVRNFTPWYEAFGVSEKNKLYLPEAERISIW
jgi:endothelin-converting enzyme/putative endopeptidase